MTVHLKCICTPVGVRKRASLYLEIDLLHVHRHAGC